MTSARTSVGATPTVRQRERPRPSTETLVPESSPPAEQPYEVGYGKPPKQSQFQPGQSGNPNGRPKRAKSPFTLLREELRSKVTLRENGRVTTVTKLEAIMKRVVADTLSGKASQTKLLFALLHVFEAQDASVPEDRNLSRSDEELLHNLLKGFADE
ncbi:MAG: hypothetical protein J0I99_06040 [Devosia sp.]|uniref:DUF5681 domain-containing protein n=1 Tax=Devosia sp. TaxID=1871048 RepID=UPI001AC020D3|nr:DUF5681 domain-containing protein [Devosia sp.]MBN9315280.1 hypothetical protein [Devosia sp.]